jgi:hypothetical protein
MEEERAGIPLSSSRACPLMTRITPTRPDLLKFPPPY